jgi:thiol-disulfide isomerase/thioredoxin
MTKFIIILTLSFLIFSCGTDKSVEKSSTSISGKIFNSEGKNVTQASVIVRSQEMGRDTLSLGDVKSDGTYEINLEKKGIFFIEFASPFHTPYFVEIAALELGAEHSLDINLAPYKYKEGSETIQLMSMSGGGGETMTAGEDGVYRAKFENNLDTFKYELSGHIVTKVGRTTNGTDHDFMEFDGAGDWMSVIVGRKGEIEITFDPSKFKRDDKEASVIANESGYKTFQLIKEKADQIENDFRKSFSLYAIKHEIEKDEFMEIKEEKSAEIANLFKLEKNENNKFYLAYRYFKITSYYESEKPEFLDENIASYLMGKLPPESELWNIPDFSFSAISLLLYNDKDIYDNSFSDTLAKYHKQIASRFYNSRIQYTFSKKDTVKARELFEIYKKDFPESRSLRSLALSLKENKNIEHGKQSPDFKLASLEDSEKFITLADYKGKYLLVDFWAVWCGPCMREMPNLHAVYEKYSGKNFEILSLSFDRQEEDVNKMREKGKYPMAWDHIFVEGGFDSDVAKDYEVLGIPKPILLDPQGKIIAFGGELRGEKLEKVLSENLEN